MPRILIAGAGPTGALCAHILRRDLQRNVELVVWDKARRAGGRMSTSVNPDNTQCTVDLGAQYITVTPHYAEKHSRYHKELVTSGLLKPLTCHIQGAKVDEKGTRHYVAPSGSSSLVKHFLNTSGAMVHYEHNLCKLEVQTTQSTPHDTQSPGRPTVGPKLVASCLNSNKSEVFDAVVLTMPTAQILQLKGLVQDVLETDSKLKSGLSSVRYSSRYAVGLFYQPGTRLDLPWCARYVEGDPCIRWIAIDSEKRLADSINVGPSIVIHTSVPFGLRYLETDKEEVQPIIMQHLHQLIPDLAEPVRVKCHRWRYSQVSTPVEGSPGCLFLARQGMLALVAAGDAFTHSNLDGCISSAETTCRNLVEYFMQNGYL